MQNCSEEFFSTDEDSKSPESEQKSTPIESPESYDKDYGNLPLEVITTVEPTSLDYQGQGNQTLKKLSNGVLTVRNIFSSHERETLRKIIDKYRAIVDTRSRTREIFIEKQNVWEEIVDEYNRTENIMTRTQKELRKCWDNMKYRAKQAEKEGKNPSKQEGNGGAFFGEDLAALSNEALRTALEQAHAKVAEKLLFNNEEKNVIKCEPTDERSPEDDTQHYKSGKNIF